MTQRPMIHPQANAYARRVTAMSRSILKDVAAELDIPYGKDPKQRLDIYPASENAPSPAPVFCFLHGGAWRNGDKEWMGFLAPLLVGLPAVFVSMSYRLSPDHRFPTHLEDALAAFAWVYERIGDYGGDPNRLFVGGHSAGGHLASLAVLRPGLLREYGIPPEAVRACLPLSAPLDLCRHPGAEDDVPQQVYDEVLASPDDAPSASPLLFADRAAVPFFIAYGEHDFPRIRRQAMAMTEALLKAGTVPVSWLELPGADHFGANADCTRIDHPWIAEVRRLLSGGEPRQGEITVGADERAPGEGGE